MAGDESERGQRSMQVVRLSYHPGFPDLKMDLFLPVDESPPVPAVLVIVGGGFRAQDGQRFLPFAEYLAEHGFAAALIGYRGRPDHGYRDTIADVKTALRFLRGLSNEYPLDPERMGAMGRSAGATLALLLGATADNPEWAGIGGNLGISTRLQAVVGIAGVYDFIGRYTDPEQLALQPNADERKETNGAWVGVPFSPERAEWKQVSAITQVGADMPPALLLHCRDDPLVPWQQSRDLHRALQSRGVDSELVVTETGGHAGPGDARERMVQFFRKVLA